jgi:DNA-binding NarL/FixJ family response regulator
VSTTALVVDDHAEFRGVVSALLRAAGYAVIGDADSAETAVAAARRLRPDVMVLDVQLPDGDGFAVVEELSRDESRPAIVLVSSREAADYGVRLRDCAARGFIHKPDLSKHSLSACLERIPEIE